MKIGNKVTTRHGRGVIIGKDLPENSCWRWVVLLDKEDFSQLSKTLRDMYPTREFCYFPKEVTNDT